ncbi:MAG: tRNA (adenosine(37)-N6)-threonylcarbamoyltransferase complex ATPase subunit type 1 TsaE [Parcubacteria group bacterium]|nr:tRNA (adenosine(37)-N6)-threonylcarbamoyltransferase complex ATPase subunit type 1 TsaE [Parcubacteria group bacterium]
METLHGVEEMNQQAEKLVASLHPQTHGATVITLSGDLGAGKTTFVQGIARALGIHEPITSPTFVIMKKYPIDVRGYHTLVHIDAYRLKSAAELTVLGWGDVCADAGCIMCVEWPERVREVLPANHTPVVLTYIDEQTRTVAIS